MKGISKLSKFLSPKLYFSFSESRNYSKSVISDSFESEKGINEEILDWKNNIFGTDKFEWLNDIDTNVEKQEMYSSLKHRHVNHLNQILIDSIEFDKILRLCFEPEDIEYYIKCDLAPMKVGDLAKRLERDIETVEDKIDELCEKGLMNNFETKGGEKYIFLPVFVGGWYENTIIKFFDLFEFDSLYFTRKEIEELMCLYFDYHQNYMIEPFNESKTKIFRYVPYLHENKEIYKKVEKITTSTKEDEKEIHYVGYEEARGILEEAEKIGVMDCVCKNMKLGFPENKGKTLEDLVLEDDPRNEHIEIKKKVCMLLNSSVDPMVKFGVATPIEKKEAFELLKELSDNGHLHAPENSKFPLFMCNCHKSFCTLLDSHNYNKSIRPVQESQFISEFNFEKCNNCGDCISKCPTKMLSLVNEKLFVDPNGWCIGCNLCAIHCPVEDAVKMVRLDLEDQKYIPMDRIEWEILRSLEINRTNELFFPSMESEFHSKMRNKIQKLESSKLLEYLHNSRMFKPLISISVKVMWLVGTLSTPLRLGKHFKDGVNIKEVIKVLTIITKEEYTQGNEFI